MTAASTGLYFQTDVASAPNAGSGLPGPISAIAMTLSGNLYIKTGLADTAWALVGGGGGTVVTDGTTITGDGSGGSPLSATGLLPHLQIGATPPGGDTNGRVTSTDPTNRFQLWLEADSTDHVGSGGNNESIQIVVRNNTAFDLSTLPSGVATGIDIDVSPSISTPGGTTTATGMLVGAHGADLNLAVNVLQGLVLVASTEGLSVAAGPTSLAGGDVTLGAHTLNASLATDVKLGTHVESFTMPGTALARAALAVGTPQVNDGTQLQTKNVATADGSCGIDVGLDTTVNPLVEGGLFITRGAGGSFGAGQKGLWVGPGNILTPQEAANDLTIYNVEATKSILFVTGGVGDSHTVAKLQPDKTATFYGAVQFGGLTGPLLLSGAGSPEGAVTAPTGSLYTSTTGGAATTLYVKESGAGNTGWVAK